jgi:enoyl-[acyl-carrier protein] reductase I
MAAEFGSSIALSAATWPRTRRSKSLFGALRECWPEGMDGMVHALAFAPREAIAGDFLEGASREAFRIAHDISAYSFVACAKAALPMMQGRRSALLTMSYLGAVQDGAQLQHRWGWPRPSLEASRTLPRRERRPAGHPGQRHLGRPDQDAGGQRHQGLFGRSSTMSSRTLHFDAT